MSVVRTFLASIYGILSSTRRDTLSAVNMWDRTSQARQTAVRRNCETSSGVNKRAIARMDVVRRRC